MTLTNAYTTLHDFKESVEIDDTLDDAILERIITAASRVIDDITGRRFYAATETRYYSAERADYLRVFDLLDITGATGHIKTDEDGDRTYEITWATTDYDLMPFNASLDGEPYRWIETTPDGDNSFPTGLTKSTEIKGSFGYSSTTPPPIQEGCIMATHRLLKRADTPLGVSAAAALGQTQVVIRELGADPDFMGLIDPYIKNW